MRVCLETQPPKCILYIYIFVYVYTCICVRYMFGHTCHGTDVGAIDIFVELVLSLDLYTGAEA